MTKDMRVIKICERCGKEFKCSPSHAKKRKHCSMLCSKPKGVRNNTGRTLFKKGQVSPMKNKHKTLEQIKASSEILKKAWRDGKFKNKRMKHDEETKKKISATQQGISLNEWEDYKRSVNTRIRHSEQYANWRLQVFIRDNFTCQECGKNKCYIEAHHKKEFAKYPELRFDINNGVTLCYDCHKKTRIEKEVNQE